jgi:SAM-dependent methyltransferase
LYADNQPYRDQPQKTVPFFSCSRCGTIYPDPRLDFSEIREYLGSMEKMIQYESVSDYHVPWYDYTSKILKRLKKQFSIKTALDVGANNGKFCMQLEKTGISATGIEPQETLVNLAQAQGPNVLLGTYPDELPDTIRHSTYDMVSMNEVICYFPDLKKSLAVAYKLLSGNGILYIKSFNGENDVMRRHDSLFSRSGDYLQAFPTISSIRFWIEDSGFKIIEIIPVPDEYFSILTGVAPEKGRMFQRLFNMVYGNLFLDRETWLSRVDRFVIIAGKRKT